MVFPLINTQNVHFYAALILKGVYILKDIHSLHFFFLGLLDYSYKTNEYY